MKFKFLFVLFFISFSLVKSQNHNIGLRAEFYAYNLEKVRDINKYSSELTFSYLPSFYVFYSYNINKELSLTFKPGVIISDKEISSFDIGLYIRYNLSCRKIYLFSGLNLLILNYENGGTGLINSIDTNPFFISIGIGHKINSHFNLDLSYYQSLKNKIGTVYITPDIYNLSGKPTNLFNIIKLSLEFII